MELLLNIAFHTLFQGVLLLLAMSLTGVRGSIAKVFAASLIAILAGGIPDSIYLSIPLQFIVLIWLLNKWTSGDNLGSIIFMVIVTWGLRMIIVLFLISSLINSI